jgi:hypothetical protein
MFSLKNWQTLQKDESQIIINASHTSGGDDPVPWTIGVNFSWVPARKKLTLDEMLFGSHENLVLCAINPATDKRRRRNSPITRESIVETLKHNNINNQTIGQVEYFKTLPTYKFVISPEGNGIDCHRHYESLLAGCIPIVEDNLFMRQKYNGLPILYTKDYSEITTEYLEKKYEEMIDKEYDFSRLFYSFYPEHIQTIMKRCGHFWIKVHTGEDIFV